MFTYVLYKYIDILTNFNAFSKYFLPAIDVLKNKF